MIALQPGSSSPLGATVVEGGVNFAVFSAHASDVVLCVFDASGQREIARYPLFGPTDDIWHGFLPAARAGLIYGFRANGRYAPDEGHRFNANKLLLDPYARSWHGNMQWHDSVYGYQRGHEDGHYSFDSRDSAPYVPKSVVVETMAKAAQPTCLKNAELADTIVYEAHVKGFTQSFPGLDDTLRGRYRALNDSAVLDYLSELGISAFECLPIHEAIEENFLAEKGLSNYWGYNSLGFFAPTQRFAERDARAEFQSMVNGLHSRGIQCWMDVVYNHTAEGDETGPTLCFRGLDNASYYRLSEDNKQYLGESGCGNTLDLSHPRVLQMVVESLAHWVTEFGIDGFRFDLASILARNPLDFDRDCAFFKTVQEHPDLKQTKLIAEPWDIGYGGYQLGSFPSPWSEWNDRYRDGIRRFWRGDAHTLAPLADMLLGSHQSFGHSDRGPLASVNFVTAHDGFTLNDLVSYTQKHNEANLEDNRDGHHDNLSCNYGVEGPTDDDAVIAKRAQHQRNVLSTLLLSQGVPMMLAGDEVKNTQFGNNNAYCQDNEISWVQWPDDVAENPHRQFVQHLISVRKRLSLLPQPHWLHGDKTDKVWALPNVSWLNESGHVMTGEQWEEAERHTVMLLLVDTNNSAASAQAVLIAINNSETDFDVPLLGSSLPTGNWHQWVDTANPTCRDDTVSATKGFQLAANSVSVLHCYNR